MSASSILFYILSAAVLMLGFISVVSRNILRSVIYLMGVLFLSAGLYVLLSAQFLAGVQVLVYVGGIVVLLVFAVMLTKTSDLLEDHPTSVRQVVAALVSAGFFGMVLKILRSSQFAAPGPAPVPGADTAAIGRAFLDAGPNGYVIPFEVISLLLLIVLVGGMVVARKSLAAPSVEKTGSRKNSGAVVPSAAHVAAKSEGGL